MSVQPQCFGSVLYHDAEARRCNACPLLETCIVKVAENQAVVKSWLNDITAAKPALRKMRAAANLGSEPIASPTSTPRASRVVTRAKDPASATANLSKKPGEFVDRWTEKGIDFKAYQEGRNGFLQSGNKFAVVAMQHFMDNPLGVSKLELTDVLIKKAGGRGDWGMGTASSHAGIVFEAFEYLGIITVSGGKAVLRM